MALPTKDQITEKLRAVIDPELRRSIVELGMVRSIEVKDDRPGRGRRLADHGGLPDPRSLRTGCRAAGLRARGRDRRSPSASTSSPTRRKASLQQTLGRGKLPEGALAQVKNVICVASGKGGVGKSTMTANLAAALTAEGHPAGALDCDVYGYSIPRMLGVNRKPDVNARAQDPAA